MIKEFKELENISKFGLRLHSAHGSADVSIIFLVREEDEKKNYKIKLAIKRMYTAVKGSKAQFTNVVTRLTLCMKL